MDWNKVRNGVLRRVVEIKFASDVHCKNVLLSMGDAILDDVDCCEYWKMRPIKKNELGIILIELRLSKI